MKPRQIKKIAYKSDHGQHKDIMKEKSTYELYQMIQKAPAGTTRRYILEHLIHARTGKWSDEINWSNYE